MATISDFLQRLAISAVYWIDDENASAQDLDVEKLVSQLAAQLVECEDGDVRKKSLGALKTHADLRSMASKVENALREESPDVERVESLLTQGFAKFEDTKATVEAALAALPQALSNAQKEALKRVFGTASVTFVAMSFGEWAAKGDKILTQYSPGDAGCLLVLDLQNTRETAAISGEDIISQWACHVAALQRSPPIYLVALTSSIRQKSELVEGRRLAQQGFSGAKVRIPIVALSKDRFTDQDDSINGSFVSSLARLRAFRLHEQLAHDLSQAFMRATKDAFDSLGQLTIEEFIYAVSTTSVVEGASEVETLTRMVSIAHKKALVKQLSNNKRARSVLMEMRGLHIDGGHALRLDDLESRDGILDLRQSEQFESSQIVNRMFAPISCGDVFEIVFLDGRRGHFVVISNACDLMLRHTGKRKLEHALLARLADGVIVGEQISSEALGVACKIKSVMEPVVLPLLVLDLCWTNKRGLSTWTRDASGDWQEYRELLPAQEERYKVIQSECSRAGSRWLWSLAPGVRTRARIDDAGSVQTFSFQVRRLGRFSLDLSNQFVDEFLRLTSRPTALHDFAS